MVRLLFDDAGETITLSHKQLSRVRASSGGRYDYFAFMVRNAGWMTIDALAHSCIIRFRPAIVAPRAFAAAAFYLADRSEERLLSVIDMPGAEPIRLPPKQFSSVVTTLSRLISDARATSGRQRFLRTEVGLKAKANSDPFQSILEARSDANSVFDIERMWRSLHNGANGRFVVLEVIEANASFRVKHLGSGFNELSKYWRPGLPVRLHDQPDHDYGCWLHGTYREVHLAQSPRIEEVDCDIWWPREGTRRHRYRRLIAPFKARDGQPLLLGVSLPDTGVDLRTQHNAVSG